MLSLKKIEMLQVATKSSQNYGCTYKKNTSAEVYCWDEVLLMILIPQKYVKHISVDKEGSNISTN